MYLEEKLAKINAEYEAKIAAVNAATQQRVAAILQARKQAIIDKNGLESEEEIIPFLNQQITNLVLQEKLLELESDVIELQITLLEQAAASTEGNIGTAFYLAELDRLYENHIARYCSMAKDRFKRKVMVVDEEGNETGEANFVYDEEKVAAETEKFATVVNGSKEAFTTFCALVSKPSNWHELARLNRLALQAKYQHFIVIQDKKIDFASDLLSLDPADLIQAVESDLTTKANQTCLDQKNALFTSLHFLCEQGDLVGITELLAQQESAEAVRELVNKADDGYLPLHLACQTGNAEVAKLLIAHGADPEMLDGVEGAADRKTAIEYALEAGIAEAVIPTKALWNKLTELVNLRLPTDFDGHYDGTQNAAFFSQHRFSPELERTLRFYYEETLRLVNDTKYNKGRHTPFHQAKLDSMLAALRQVVLDVARVLNPMVILPELSTDKLQELCHDVKVAFAKPMCLARNRCCFWKFKTPDTLSRAQQQFGELPEQYRPSLYW